MKLRLNLLFIKSNCLFMPPPMSISDIDKNYYYNSDDDAIEEPRALGEIEDEEDEDDEEDAEEEQEEEEDEEVEEEEANALTTL